MGTYYDEITPAQAELIDESNIFFIASVAQDLSDGSNGGGPVNVSPKGGVPLHIIDNNHVAYLDYPGSGNETARHAEANGPCTVMVMSMGEDAAIVRLYGRARVTSIDESPLAEQILAESAEGLTKPRQIIEVEVDRTQTSCGYGVPLYTYVGERTSNIRGRRFKEPRRQPAGE